MSSSDGSTGADPARQARRERLRARHPGWEPARLRDYYVSLGWSRACLVRKLDAVDPAAVTFTPPSPSSQMVTRHERGDAFPGEEWQAANAYVTGASRLELGFCARLPDSEPDAAGHGLAYAAGPGQDGASGPDDAGPALDLARLWRPAGLLPALEEVVDLAHSLERRTLLALTGATLAGAAHEWLVADPARLAAALGGKRVDAEAVADLGSAVDTLRRLDDKFGGRAVYGMVTEQLRFVVGLLRNTSYTQADGQRLYGFAAELARLAGWASFDAGRNAAAQRFFVVGLRAAHEAADPAVGANILRCMAVQARTEGDHRTSVELLRSARAGTRGTLAPTQDAGLASSLARAYGHLGDRNAALRAIDTASTYMQRARTEETPPFLYWFSSSEITWTTGVVLLHSGDPQAAVPHLRASIEALGHGLPRDLISYQVDLCTAHARAGEVDRAISLGHQMVDDAAVLDSGVARTFVREFCREVEATGHPETTGLTDHARTVLGRPDV